MRKLSFVLRKRKYTTWRISYVTRSLWLSRFKNWVRNKKKLDLEFHISKFLLLFMYLCIYLQQCNAQLWLRVVQVDWTWNFGVSDTRVSLHYHYTIYPTLYKQIVCSNQLPLLQLRYPIIKAWTARYQLAVLLAIFKYRYQGSILSENQNLWCKLNCCTERSTYSSGLRKTSGGRR